MTFEHPSISMTFFLNAACTIILDRAHIQAQVGLTQIVGAIGFAHELLLFHFHSTDHMGPEGQFHLIFQILVFVSFLTTLIGIGRPNSFGIFSQGLWEIVMGIMLWTFIILVTIFAVSFYLIMVKLYGENVHYFSLENEEDQESNDHIVESPKKGTFANTKSFIHMAKISS